MPNSWDVFLSHSSRDKERARILRDALRDRDVSVWFDEEQIRPGDSIPLKVEEGIEYSKAVIVCLSPNYLDSHWTPAERAAFTYSDPNNKKRTLIPVIFEDCKVPRSLAHLLYVDYRQPSLKVVDKIVDVLTATQLGFGERRNSQIPIDVLSTNELWDLAMAVEECFQRNAADSGNARKVCREHLVRLGQLRLRLTPHLPARALLIIDDYVATLIEVQDRLECSGGDGAMASWAETTTGTSELQAVALAARQHMLRGLLARKVAELDSALNGGSVSVIDEIPSTSDHSKLGPVRVSDDLEENVAQALLRSVHNGRIRVCPCDGFAYSIQSLTLGLVYLKIRPETPDIDLLAAARRRPENTAFTPALPLISVMEIANDGVVLAVWHTAANLYWNYRWRGATQVVIARALGRIQQRGLAYSKDERP